MIDIIAKLEAATGSTFELNAAIARLDWYREQFGDCADNEVPDFCGSIDAAMTLVPQSDDPTWRWRIVEFQEWNKGNSYWFWRARISGWPNMRPVYECGEHPIPALALCIAALKARSRSPQP